MEKRSREKSFGAGHIRDLNCINIVNLESRYNRLEIVFSILTHHVESKITVRHVVRRIREGIVNLSSFS